MVDERRESRKGRVGRNCWVGKGLFFVIFLLVCFFAFFLLIFLTLAACDAEFSGGVSLFFFFFVFPFPFQLDMCTYDAAFEAP